MRATPYLLSTLPPTLRTILASPSLPPPTAITVQGWLRTVRLHKNVAFGTVSDGSGEEGLQAVFDRRKVDVEGLSAGASVRLRGRLEASRGGGQKWELKVEESTILGLCDPEVYPIQKKSLPPSVLRENAHLRFRTGLSGAVTRLRDGIMRDWHDWFEEEGFVHIHTPILTSSDCEGAGEVFTLRDADHPPPPPPSTPFFPSQISSSLPSPTPSPPSPSLSTSSRLPSTPTPEPFFPHPVNLTVSSQLHLEAPTHSLSRTYTLSPAFRAEPSQTSRHLSEFYMLEGEAAFLDSLDSLLDLVEGGIKATLRALLDGTSARSVRARENLAGIQAALGENELVEQSGRTVEDLRRAKDEPFARMSYTEALARIERQHSEQQAFDRPPPAWGEGLASEHEKWLAESEGRPIFVTRFPESLKPFYMLPSLAPSPAEGGGRGGGGGGGGGGRETVECFDLLFPHLGEMAGGSLREHRLEELERAMVAQGMRTDEYGWYLDLRRYGSVPHGGWGMGWERWVCWVSGVSNVRDVVAFPRWRGHCSY